MRVLRHSLSLETCISIFQIDMARMDKRFVKELLMESFARPALRRKRSSARELNATRACSQALRGVVSYMLLSPVRVGVFNIEKISASKRFLVDIHQLSCAKVKLSLMTRGNH